MKHLDITLDLETCSTAPDAAPMQLAAVVWDRYATGEHPFLDDEFFNVGIDLRTCVVEGFSFDQETVDWWNRQNETAKRNVSTDICYPVGTAFELFCDWFKTIKQRYDSESICLWCQGLDFDIPVLKTIARRFGQTMPAHYHYFRDSRTYMFETALVLATSAPSLLDDDHYITPDEIMERPSRIYGMIPEINKKWVEGRAKHDAVYDCARTSWSVWQFMKLQEKSYKQ